MELGALAALATLRLHNNQLIGDTSLSAALGRLTGLTLLSLEGNELTSVPTEWEQGGAPTGGEWVGYNAVFGSSVTLSAATTYLKNFSSNTSTRI